MLQMGRLMKPQLRCRNLDLTRKVFQSNVLLLHFSKLHCEIERAPSALGFGGWMNRVTDVLRVCCLLELWDWLSTDTVWWWWWVVILALLCISDFHSCEPLSHSFFFSFFRAALLKHVLYCLISVALQTSIVQLDRCMHRMRVLFMMMKQRNKWCS